MSSMLLIKLINDGLTLISDGALEGQNGMLLNKVRLYCYEAHGPRKY